MSREKTAVKDPPDSLPEGRTSARERKAEEEKLSKSRIVAFAMKVTKLGEKAKAGDAEDLRKRFLAYLRLCETYGMKVGNMAAYAAMGTDHVGVERTMEEAEEDDPVRALYLFVKRYCALYREALLEEGCVRESTGLFWQKTFDGVKDRGEERRRQPGGKDGEGDPGEWMEKYRELFLD